MSQHCIVYDVAIPMANYAVGYVYDGIVFRLPPLTLFIVIEEQFLP